MIIGVGIGFCVEIEFVIGFVGKIFLLNIFSFWLIWFFVSVEVVVVLIFFSRNFVLLVRLVNYDILIYI